MTTGGHRRETDDVADTGHDGLDRRTETENKTEHHRRKQDFFTKYRQPLIGLGLAGAALPLANAQQHAEHEKTAPVEPAAEQAPASAEAAAAAKQNDTEETLVSKIASSREDE